MRLFQNLQLYRFVWIIDSRQPFYYFVHKLRAVFREDTHVVARTVAETRLELQQEGNFCRNRAVEIRAPQQLAGTDLRARKDKSVCYTNCRFPPFYCGT